MDSDVTFPSAPEYGPVPQYPIESVDNALRLCWLISEHGTVRLTDATNFLGVASSTAHRLLAMLQYRGFVQQDAATRAYHVGPVLDDIGLRLLRRSDVRERARPILDRLSAEVEETIHLGQLRGSTVRFVDAIESPRAVRVASRLGQSMPAHLSSTGKALLARLSDAELHQLYPDEDLVTLTPQSISTRTDLIRELHEIRKIGYAVSRGEGEAGVSSIAMAVDRISPPTSINVSVPSTHVNVNQMRRIIDALTKAVADLERRAP